jgi:fumarate hydratase subunit alpha
MRVIRAEEITGAVADLCAKANCVLREDVLRRIKAVYSSEPNKRAKKALGQIIENARLAKKEKMAICQDTGLPLVFVEMGQEARVSGDFNKAVLKGVALGYRQAHFRESIVSDPVLRGRPGYAGAVIHTDIVRGSRIKITVMPKGFGCENKSLLKMFNPTAGIEEIKSFIVEAVKTAGPDACPPYVVGVGIGGTADLACLLAKKALLKRITDYELRITDYVSRISSDLLKEVNKLNVGPMGLGGKTTCLGVNIETHPTHIAGLPVAVNISCHALRSATATL